MGIAHTEKYCKRCEKHVLAQKKTANHILHLLLSIFTAGLWIIMWILVGIRIGGWRCSQCGLKIGL